MCALVENGGDFFREFRVIYSIPVFWKIIIYHVNISNCKIRKTLLHLRDSDDLDVCGFFASIIGISQVQRAQCGFLSLTSKRDGLFFYSVDYLKHIKIMTERYEKGRPCFLF